MMEGFPESALVGSLQKTWHSSAVGIYRNWLEYLAMKKATVSPFAAVTGSYAQSGKRSAIL